jgi:hypothetical protein
MSDKKINGNTKIHDFDVFIRKVASKIVEIASDYDETCVSDCVFNKFARRVILELDYDVHEEWESYVIQMAKQEIFCHFRKIKKLLES